jgi:hypothetical protein
VHGPCSFPPIPKSTSTRTVTKEFTEFHANPRKIVPSFEFVETFGVHLDTNESYSKPDWNSYLQSSERYLDMYKCGRPLIYDMLLNKCNAEELEDEKFLDTEYSSCSSSRIMGIDKDYPETLNEHQVFTILGLSVGFGDFRRATDKDVLISSHMTSLLGYNYESGTFIGVYPPEGILNAVASWHLCRR